MFRFIKKVKKKERKRNEILEGGCLGQDYQVECSQSIEQLW